MRMFLFLLLFLRQFLVPEEALTDKASSGARNQTLRKDKEHTGILVAPISIKAYFFGALTSIL